MRRRIIKHDRATPYCRTHSTMQYEAMQSDTHTLPTIHRGAAMTHRLHAEAVTLKYDERTVATDLSVSIPDASFTVIVGPNACGKSTLLRALSRLLKPSQGRSFSTAAISRVCLQKRPPDGWGCCRKARLHRKVSLLQTGSSRPLPASVIFEAMVRS